jgi:hypothetical protein
MGLGLKILSILCSIGHMANESQEFILSSKFPNKPLNKNLKDFRKFNLKISPENINIFSEVLITDKNFF